MKFSTNRESLIDVLKKLRPFVSTRSLLPVLQNVRVATFAEGQVMLSTTNLDVQASMTLAAEVQEAGETTLPFTLLVNVLGEMSGEQVAFAMGAQDSKKERTVITSDLAESALIGIAANEFPKDHFALTDNSMSFVVDSTWLKARFERVGYAATEDDTRPVLKAVYFRVVEGHLTMVATNGFQMALIDEPGALDTAVTGVSVLLPAAAVQHVLHMLSGEVTLTVNCQRVKFETEMATVVVAVPEYEYPNYQPIIPTGYLHVMRLDRARAIAAARLALVIAQEDSLNKAVVLRVMTDTADAGTGTLVMSASVSAVGANEARAELAHVAGNHPFDQMGMNGRYLLDTLTHAPDGEIVIETISRAEPLVVRSASDATWLGLVMPLHLGR